MVEDVLADLHVAAHGQRGADRHPQRAPRRGRPAQRLDPLVDRRARGDGLAHARRGRAAALEVLSARTTCATRASRTSPRPAWRCWSSARRSPRRSVSRARRTSRGGPPGAARGPRRARRERVTGTGVPHATANPCLPWGQSCMSRRERQRRKRRNRQGPAGAILLVLGLLVVVG